MRVWRNQKWVVLFFLSLSSSFLWLLRVLWSEFVWSVGRSVLDSPFIQCAVYGDVDCDVFYGVSGSAVWGARLWCYLRASGVPRSSRETFLGQWIASFAFTTLIFDLEDVS